MNRKDEKVTQIINAATQEFLIKGLEAASMHNIAELAEVSKRTLYKYFPNKELLFQSLIDELLDHVSKSYEIKYDKSESFEEQLSKILRKKIEYTLSDSFINISRIVIGEMLKSKKVNDKQMEKMARSEALFLNWLDDAKSDKKITSDLDSQLIANRVHHLIKGEIFWPVLIRIVDKDQVDIDIIVKSNVEYFLASFCS